jgi:two-component system, response regulator
MILLVEDNPDDEVLTLRALKKSRVTCNVVVARDGVEALDYLFGTGARAGRDTSVQPRLILIDLNLPRISGLELLERVRADERTRFIPMVVLTSSKEDADVIASYARGANAYVRKPVDFAKFTEVVDTLCMFWLQLNERPPQRG